MVFMTILSLIVQIVLFTFTINANVELDENDIIWIILGFSTILLFSLLIALCMFSFQLSWLDKFCRICKNHKLFSTIHHSQKCLDLYKSIQNGVGNMVLGFFTFGQVIIVITIYMCISTAFSSLYDISTKIIVAICYAILSIFFGINMYIMILAAENTHTSLQKLTKSLKIIVMKEKNEEIKIQAKLLKDEIKNIPTLNGNGYFELKKDTLTSITSTTVTYLIILFQFRGS